MSGSIGGQFVLATISKHDIGGIIAILVGIAVLVFGLMRAAIPVMPAQRSGSIILTASVSGLTAWSHAAPYCATKAAVIQLAKVAAVEYARDGIRVNCVCPGTFRSGIHAGLPPVQDLARITRRALAARTVVEQAKGVIADQTGLDMAASFDRLRALADQRGQPLETVARDLVSSTTRPAPRPPAGD